MPADLNKIFDQFNNYKVLIIGDVMVDTYISGTVDRISPEAPVPIVNCTRRDTRLGGAANVALNIKAMGASAFLCSVIGTDEKSEEFDKLMKRRKLDAKGILKIKGRKTSEKTRIIGNKQHMLRVDDERIQPLNDAEENQFIDHIKKLVEEEGIEIIILQDYDKGVITTKVIDETIELANSKSIETFVDPKKNNFYNFKNITMFKPNFKEFCEGVGQELDKRDFDSLNKAAMEFQEKQKIDYLLVTLSELGVFIRDDDSYRQIQSEPRDIVDVSGAGDTVISVAALCKKAGLKTSEIAAVANLAGGIVCQRVGVVPVDRRQLLQESIDFFQIYFF